MRQLFIPLSAICLLASTFSCTKAKYDDDYQKGDVPPIGQYKNSSDVAASNLLAHWTFDSTMNEAISGTGPTTAINNSWVQGVKGPALHFDAGYALYPVIAGLDVAQLGSVSVSLWINVDNNGSQASEFFALTQAPAVQSDWGAVINVYAETGHPVSSDDTLALHSAVGSYASGSRVGGDNINDYGTAGTDFQILHGTNQWVHYVMVYDGTAQTLDLYANSILVSNNNFRLRTGVGELVAPIPVQALIGGWPNVTTGFPLSGAQSWQALLTGSMDELRVYNKALSQTEIHALYFFEKLGD